MRVQRISHSEYVPSESIEWGSRPVSAPGIASEYASQGIYVWEDGYVTEGRLVRRSDNVHAKGWYAWLQSMHLGETYKDGSKWVAYNRTGDVLGKYATKTAAAIAIYEAARSEQAA